ncbi:MAG: Modulator of FtsH protease HflK [Lentisphaerae bacterium ADurb.Bin242]|nr:MAG: Modulator of FtsH protease HflK [Lentisphaerae bacterium ADurb.Bin242]
MANDSNNLSAVMERYALSVRLAGVSCVVSAALSILVFLAGPVYEWSGFVTFSLAAIPFVLAFVFSLLALIHSKFSENAVHDEEEKILLRKRKESKTSLLDVSEDVRFTAGRTLLNFEKYIPSTVAILCALLMAVVLVLFWRNFIFRPEGLPILSTGLPKQPILLAFTSALCAAVSVFLGIFLAGQSHVFEFRWLRPVGAWMMAGAVIMLFTVVSSILAELKITHWNAFFSKISFFALAVLCLELFSNFISEFYRPRNQMEDRPVYESRFLSFFTEPGGIMRNIADSLDYQFGFKVSRTWIYGFLEKSILPALLLWLFLFWIFTALCEVAPGEVGIRERFGSAPKNAAVLSPGVYFKMPWPFERIVRVSVNAVHEVLVGGEFRKDGKELKPAVVLWTTEHGQPDDGRSGGYLVANEQGGTEVSNAVSILETMLPVSYKVKPDQAHTYVFRFKDIPGILKNISEQESTRYFASTDFIRDMSSGREKIVKELQSRIQAETDRLALGIEIVCVNMTDAHPPFKEVAPAFQEVLAAKEEAKGMVFAARAEAAKLFSEGRIKSLGITSEAAAYKFNVSNVASADAFRFQRQLKAYNEQPQLFRLRTYLDFLENDCKDLRKYVLSSKMPSQIYEVNMEEKPRLDLLEGADVQNLGK